MMTPEQKVATLMVFLGEERAATLLASLPKDVVRRVLGAVGRLEKVDEATVNQVVNEVLTIYQKQTRGTGDFSASRRILAAASQALDDPSLLDEMSADFSLNEIREDLENIRAQSAANWLKSEQPPVMAVVLSIASPGKAAEIFRLLPDTMQLQVCLAIAALKGVEANTVEIIQAEVRKLRDAQSKEVSNIGGVETVTNLVQNLSPEFRNQLLDRLQEKNPDLTNQIKKQILSIERLSSLLPADMAKLCAEMRDHDLILVLKAEPNHIREKVLVGVSKNRRESLLEQLGTIGPQKRSDVDACRQKFVEKAIVLHEKGVINFPWEDQLV